MDRGAQQMAGFSGNRSGVTLEDVVRHTRGETISQMQGRNPRSAGHLPRCENGHSVPLLPALNGTNIYVSKRSPLLKAYVRERFHKQCYANVDWTKKWTLPSRKTVKFDENVERIVVPAFDKPLRQPYSKFQVPATAGNVLDRPSASTQTCSFPDKPLPLVASTIYRPEGPVGVRPMEVEDTPAGFQINRPGPSTEPDVIHMETDLPF